ncbi:U4/U6-U5 snRNP complex subunit PRP31 NDAI_0G01290 [Naumovozyma dairenensis CBS 421]|uniref:Nop domain-containing protein n=1 Tax=Naumovozyma dairenensis (strain ATCC 10597 / BCRC 20456 / CBS 421 / NBRC 0211 / NRRL Y-12639) TaxID=1071378 RepID=G0WDP4_NAUDC|nr:hypothetical protein NDAI_0G01290 [Naumovozyma dairenensis CBS 421]CCD25905.2 hypothetical protein NDAI_0G01290 [Naumovozyma dairenensis CBS 421]
MSDLGEDEEDFLNDLEADLGGDVDEVDSEEQDEEAVIDVPIIGKDVAEEEDDLQFLDSLVRKFTPVISANSLFEKQHVETLSIIYEKHQRINSIISSQNIQFSSLLPRLNEITHIIKHELQKIYHYLRFLYSKKFNELDTITSSQLQYARIVKIFESHQDLSSGELNNLFENEAKLTKEQIIVLNISMKSSFDISFKLDHQKQKEILKSTDMITTLSALQELITHYITSNISHIAPNLCALIGSQIAALLISHAGSILDLSQIPSCNLASIGKSKHQSHELHTSLSGVRQEGYIYDCDLIQDQPSENHKQMLRMVCAKASLAARVDAGSKTHKGDGTLGQNWKNELLEKIQKLKEPPNQSAVKPLPIPEDKPKKKRAGRKFRKYKQQFELSHLRQLQNRMEFGNQEQTTLDAFGEEIGMGMATSSVQNAMGSASLKGLSVNNSAKMTKVMKRRLKDAEYQSNAYMVSLTSDNVDNPEFKKQKPNNDTDTDWYSHHR